MAFWIFWGIDAVAAAILVVFFMIGIVDGSVSSFNIDLWLLMLAVAALVLGAGDALRRSGKLGLATTLLAVFAFPTILMGVFLLVVLILQPNWI
jgi:hypothetical protein